MSEENIENINKSDSNFAPTIADHHVLPDINFNANCLINNIYIPTKVINKYISYILNPQLKNLNTDFTLGYCLFGSVKLTKNDDLEKYKYSSFGIGLILVQNFYLQTKALERNVIIFGADMGSSVHIYNKNKDILILGEGATQGLDDTALKAEAKYPINSTQSGKRFVVNLHYIGNNSLLFVNDTKICQFKAKIPEIKDHKLCLDNILKSFTIDFDNMK